MCQSAHLSSKATHTPAFLSHSLCCFFKHLMDFFFCQETQNVATNWFQKQRCTFFDIDYVTRYVGKIDRKNILGTY